MIYFVIFLILVGLVVPALAEGQSCVDSAFPDDGKQVNLDHNIIGGKIAEICQSKVDNSVIVKIDANTDGTLSIEIPGFMVYSLVGTNCEQDPSQIFVIMDQEEIPLLDLKSTEYANIFTVGFDKGVHTIEFVGSFVVPSPSPAQYCGIVKGHDKKYLPPKIQVELGVESKFIRCNESLMLVFKSDGTPACVKPETKEKLVQRQWVQDKKWTASYDDDSEQPTVMILPGSSNPEQLENVMPQEIAVMLGHNSTVTWINGDRTSHNLISDDPNIPWWTGLLHPGESSSVTFNNTGVFAYHGDPGPWITGKVIVTDTNNFSKESPISNPNAFAAGVTEIVNPEYEHLKYKTTITTQVIDDTYLSRNVEQWLDASQADLEAEYEKYGDEFYIELGRLLLKNEFKYQMQTIGIVNANEDFEVFNGMMLTSLPPHIQYTAVVLGTDQNYYRLQGTSYSNQVSFYSIALLQFPDTAIKLSMESILDKENLITIMPEDGNKARQDPSTLVIHKDNSSIEFFNNTPETIRIQDSGSGRIGEEHTLSWMGPIILPYQSATMTFDEPGLVEWDARNAPNLEDLTWWSTHAGGFIVVLSDDMNNLPLEERLRIAQVMLHQYPLPIMGSGSGNAERALIINLDPAVTKMIPDAEQYYLQRIYQIIPFDVNVIIEK